MTCSDKGHFEINLPLKHNVGDPESVFTTIRVELDGPIHIEGHLRRLIEAHASLFGSNLEIEENDIIDIMSRSSNEQEPPYLVRLDIDKSERITASPRTLTRMPKEIRLSTQPLPPGPNSARIKQGDWAGYIEARRMANYNGADAGLLINQGLVVDGDTFTPIFILENGDIALPALDLGAVKSVTLNQILNQDSNSRITPLQKRITLSEAYSCLSAAAVGSGMGIRRILSINDREIGVNSDVDLANILRQHQKLIRRENLD
ncbi:MAG: hypothetical protein CBD52_001600 [Euryarchaeota archaeon TMED192]|nr:MAG: hypothetical protein CBD52_001600 [Euryarchaeota archaeon TMED192]|tara:strand:+ start:2565 stop:3347 length:783 start_codon:yes stop_codon:yes gene_type:complete